MNKLDEVIDAALDCLTFEAFKDRLRDLRSQWEQEDDDDDIILNDIRQQG